MTKNQKAFCTFLRTMALTAVFSASIALLGVTYGEPPRVEYNNHITQK